ncbi:TonB-dependent siderophore receptor [Herbaspirillum sp. meg3]|uniref:TonB-dependent receptor n=1 Tax=Herbaspirillum sp. meg3 TaxID=2025949 RepID=UPI000B98A8B1|nr:TonB-dependent siderophore receptor [Herbaspirillum sp. meg3]ASU38049.1 TonB-dependent siderophore receptor [Herbaspirillum sp. meg3]
MSFFSFRRHAYGSFLCTARLRPLAIAICSIASSFDYAYAAEEAGSEAGLPTVEIRSKRSHYDPRPASVNTATRSDTETRDIPQTINSVAVEDVASYGGRTLADALSGIPGISNASDTRFDAFRIRGFSSVGDLFLDGIRDDAQYVRGLGNIERVEVLKGPAAVLYGRGSGGGVINRISKQPGHDVQNSVQVSAGSYGRLGASADVNQVLSDEWTMRVNAGRERADSFRSGVDSTRQYVAPSIKWDDQRTSWLLQTEYNEFERVPDRGMPAGRRANGSYYLPPAAPSTTYGALGRDDIKDTSTNIRSTLEHKFNNQWKIRNVLSVLALDSRFDNTFAGGLAGPGNSMVTRSRFLQDLKQRNLQAGLELEGKVMTGSVEHRLLFGSEYTDETRHPRLWRANATSVSLLTPNNAPDNGPTPTVFSNSVHKARGYALYAQDQIRLSPQWQILAGLRWDRFAADSLNQVNNSRAQRTTAAISPRLGVVWSPLRDHSFYASYSKNFIPSGGADTVGLDTGTTSNVNALDPQFSRQVEVGVKSDWFDKKISSTLAIFQLDLYNRRTQVASSPDLFVLTGLERNRGIELGVNGQLASNWFIRSGFSVQNARVLESGSCRTCGTNIQGKRSVGVSSANGSLFISYAPTQGFFAETGVVYEGARYVDINNSLDLPAYTRWDAKMGYRFRNAEVTFAVANLANKNYYVTSTGLSQIMPGSPRSGLLSAAYKF